jgi:hypothetical protein
MKKSSPGQDVWTDDALDGIQHVGVPHDLVDPGQQEMALRAQAARRQAARLLDRMQALPVAGRLRGR